VGRDRRSGVGRRRDIELDAIWQKGGFAVVGRGDAMRWGKWDS